METEPSKNEREIEARKRQLAELFLAYVNVGAMSVEEAGQCFQSETQQATCKFNAQSRYLRCAVNPCGPCENCGLYEAST